MPREKKAEPWEELSAVIKIKVKRRATMSILRSDVGLQTVIFSSPHRFRSHHGNCHQRAPHHLLFIAAALQFLSKTTNFFGALWARYPASATSGYNLHHGNTTFQLQWRIYQQMFDNVQTSSCQQLLFFINASHFVNLKRDNNFAPVKKGLNPFRRETNLMTKQL